MPPKKQPENTFLFSPALSSTSAFINISLYYLYLLFFLKLKYDEYDRLLKVFKSFSTFPCLNGYEYFF